MTPLEIAMRDTLQNRKGPHVSQTSEPHATASEAQKCARQISFRLLGVGQSEEFSTTTLLAFHLGDEIHGITQDALAQLYPDFQSEVVWSLFPKYHVTGRADGLFTDDEGRRVVVEIKSMNPLTFQRTDKRDTPNYEHALQAHISAYALQADLIYIIYVNKAGKQESSPVLEWLAEADHGIAEIEAMRMHGAVQKANQGILSDRWYDGDIISDPSAKKWPCAWCAWRSECIQAGSGEKRLIIPTPLVRNESQLIRGNNFDHEKPA